jgi:hypothetical protein
MIPFKIVSGNPDIQPTWPLLLKTEKVDEIVIFFLGSPILGPRWTLLLFINDSLHIK